MPGSTSTSGIGKFERLVRRRPTASAGVELAGGERLQHAEPDLGQRPATAGGDARPAATARSTRARTGRRRARGRRTARCSSDAGGRLPRVVTKRMRTRRARPRGDRRHVGLRRRRRCARGRPPSSRRPRARRSRGRGRARRATGPDPDRLQPSAPASTAARLIAARPGTSDARRGSAIVSSSAREISAKSPRCRPSTSAPRFAHCRMASASGTVVAEQRARLRRLDLEIGMNDDGRQAGRDRQPDDVGRIRMAHEHEAAADRRRDVVGVRRPAPSRSPSSAHAISVSIDARRTEQRVDGDDRRRGARRAAAEAARERQALADGQRHAAPLAERASAAPARRRRPCCARASRGSRPSSPTMSSIVTPDAPVEPRRHLVARRVERETEHVEAARDVRHGRRRKGGHDDRMQYRLHDLSLGDAAIAGYTRRSAAGWSE